ncbi:OmpA family protein [Castellaniella hirudinis]|uniref:OmpA family protein n=1 Tax=Castellaniella hirudinis TaxID=1144617 RepID=A0ABV8S352_9BURK
MPNFRLFTCCLALWSAALVSGPCQADAVIPTADIPNAADSPLLKRYEGAFIVSYTRHDYAELDIPLSPLKPSATADERDGRNNRVYRPEQAETAAGTLTRLAYVLPANRSPLEVLRNYQDEVTAAGGSVAFECKLDACGGDPHRASEGGGGKMSLTQHFFYDSDLKDKAFSNGACALTSRINDQRFFAARIPRGDATAWLAVQTYQLNGNTYCKALNGRTIAIVHALEPKARDRKMVAVQADDMRKAIDQDGSISLYGIYFDTAAATLKPESAPTLKEIAALLSAQPDLALLVVGHTDSQGQYDYNVRLSERRAQAVKTALVSQYGIAAGRLTPAGAGMMAPVATNTTEEGRAKNRRVALVRAH